MKRLLLTPFLLLIPSAQALDYVECEAIRAVISRNSIQRQKAFKDAYDDFKYKKMREKYGTILCTKFGEYGTAKYKECRNFEDNVWKNFPKEGEEFRESVKLPYNNIEERASKDFDKKGCFWF